MRNLFFKLDSGQIVDLQKLQLIEKYLIWFEYNSDHHNGLKISVNDYKRIKKILNPEWIDVEVAMEWASKKIKKMEIKEESQK